MLTELKTAVCQHFGTCGGCACVAGETGAMAPLPYQEELAAKEARVHRLLEPFEVSHWDPIVASPEEWYYRNKMEYAFGPPLLLGLREAGRFNRVVDLKTCLLMSPDSLELVARVRQWALDAGFSGYDRRAHSGQLRYLVVREGKNTGERMGMLLASGSLKDRRDAVNGALRQCVQSLCTTFWLGFTDRQGDVARAESMELLWGPGTIRERVGAITFRISPYSFFQTNTHGAEHLYQRLSQWASQGPGGALLDVFCGSGGIGLSLARHFDRVLGLDSNPEAIADARFNAEANQIRNTEFVAAEAVSFLDKLPASKLAVQLSSVVTDPPRPGLQPRALEALMLLNPPRMAYVSCNPETLARDLQGLIRFYKIDAVQTVDLFPHTPHVETLVTLEHR